MDVCMCVLVCVYAQPAYEMPSIRLCAFGKREGRSTCSAIGSASVVHCSQCDSGLTRAKFTRTRFHGRFHLRCFLHFAQHTNEHQCDSCTQNFEVGIIVLSTSATIADLLCYSCVFYLSLDDVFFKIYYIVVAETKENERKVDVLLCCDIR